MTSQDDAAAVYRTLDARMPWHAGASGRGAEPFTARSLADPAWVRERIELAARLYGRASDAVLGTVSWYSASSVLVAPAVESRVATGTALDPGLDSVTLYIRHDGRFTGASSGRPLGTDMTALGAALYASLEPAIEGLAAESGARSRALWAIAADSIANRLLWSGQAIGKVTEAKALATPLAEAIGPALPRPRYAEIGPHTVVRRVSCCLIDKATGGDKCTSCPNQHPDTRERRIRAALGS